MSNDSETTRAANQVPRRFPAHSNVPAFEVDRPDRTVVQLTIWRATSIALALLLTTVLLHVALS